MGKLLNIVGFFLMGLGIVLIVYLRVKGLHLTEGELLARYWPQWILSAGLLFGGYAIFLRTK